MIDWFNVFANGLWIFSLALALAVISYARWEAIHRSLKLKAIINEYRWQVALNIAGMFFCAGLAFTTPVLWERILWWVLFVLFLIQIGLAYITRRQQDGR